METEAQQEQTQTQTQTQEQPQTQEQAQIQEKEQTQAVPPNRKKGVTGSTLKLIAIIAMFIDHTGAVILERMLFAGGEPSMQSVMDNWNLYMVYMVLRMIGRLGFPVFCFLLIEGFKYTRNVKKYAGRLFLFALISEVPFDLGFVGQPIFWKYQNVFFTLFIGLLVMIGLRIIQEKQAWNKVLRAILCLLVLAAGMVSAEFLHTDYGSFGVLTIAVMYMLRYRKTLEAGAGCAVLTAMSLMEATSFFVLIPISRYNGQRGWNIKWLFYAFYPVHILLLYLLACALGLGNVSMAAFY